MTTPLEIPTITPDNLANFHHSHFSTALHTRFTVSFLSPGDRSNTNAVEVIDIADTEMVALENDDDDLGYYPDGVKRTLTDLQISMFRFSEIQRLLAIKRRNLEKRRQHKERRARKKAYEDELAVAEESAKQKAAANADNPPSPEGHRKGRLEAAMWASGLPWDEEDTSKDGESNTNQQSLGTKEHTSAHLFAEAGNGSISAPGSKFMWPIIKRDQ
ncbi:hypothetical protein RUND412_001590 [Rhizina undulata]